MQLNAYEVGGTLALIALAIFVWVVWRLAVLEWRRWKKEKKNDE